MPCGLQGSALGRPREQHGGRHGACGDGGQAGQHVLHGLGVQRARALKQLVGRHRQDGQVAGQPAAAARRDLLRRVLRLRVL